MRIVKEINKIIRIYKKEGWIGTGSKAYELYDQISISLFPTSNIKLYDFCFDKRDFENCFNAKAIELMIRGHNYYCSEKRNVSFQEWFEHAALYIALTKPEKKEAYDNTRKN